MTVVAEKRLITADELLAMPRPEGKTELVRGGIVHVPPTGDRHGQVTARVSARIQMWAEERHLGEGRTGEAGFLLARSPDTVRAPDAAFISSARLGEHRGFFPGAPDLAVEVMSPNDAAPEMDAKAKEYLTAGSRLVWVLDPDRRVVHVYHPDGTTHMLSGDAALSGEDVLPGLELPLPYLFG